jgi:hypothetical protein
MANQRQRSQGAWGQEQRGGGSRSGSERDRRRVSFSAKPTAVDATERKETINAHKAALEALFAPKVEAPPPTPARHESVKLVTVPRAAEDDPRKREREKLLGRLLGAEGRLAVSKAADEYLRAGFELPQEQEVLLQLLDHAEEERVRHALSGLTRVLDDQQPKRRTVLESRLRRLEDSAEDEATRDLTKALRRKLSGARSRV